MLHIRVEQKHSCWEHEKFLHLPSQVACRKGDNLVELGQQHECFCLMSGARCTPIYYLMISNCVQRTIMFAFLRLAMKLYFQLSYSYGAKHGTNRCSHSLKSPMWSCHVCAAESSSAHVLILHIKSCLNLPLYPKPPMFLKWVEDFNNSVASPPPGIKNPWFVQTRSIIRERMRHFWKQSLSCCYSLWLLFWTAAHWAQ